MAASKTGEEKRQVFDLPEKQLIVTEHRAAIHDCPACGLRMRADFPEKVVSQAQYGERAAATMEDHLGHVERALDIRDAVSDPVDIRRVFDR